MTAVKDAQETYLSNFEARERELAAAGPSWLNEIRRAAIHRFAELGFPTRRDEQWKYTNLAPLASLSFQPAGLAGPEVGAKKLKEFPCWDLECTRLVFINGHYSRELSTIDGLPKGVKVGSLARAFHQEPAVLEEHLARYAEFQNHAFVALNTAFMTDGAFVEIPKGLVLDKPIYLLFLSAANGRPTLTHPRNLILAGRESQATLIETYVGLDEGTYLTNAVSEIVAGEGAVLQYCKVQRETRQAFHVGMLQIQQERSSSVTTHSFAFGGSLDREDLNAVLGGEGADCLLHGLYVTRGKQHVDNHTVIDHAKAHCSSRELYKGVLDDQSTGVFNGGIIVRKDAQKTDSKQSNKNLLLSEGAVINTKPQLEIFADDVKCTHGATIGQVDPEAVFYLRSRGIGREEARSLLTFAFANEIIEGIKYAPLRDRLRDTLLAQRGPSPRTRDA